MFSDTSEEAAKLINGCIRKVKAAPADINLTEALHFLVGLQLRIAHFNGKSIERVLSVSTVLADPIYSIPVLHLKEAQSQLGWQWPELFVQLCRREDWASIDMLMTCLDRHNLQSDILCGTIEPPTPRDNLGQIGHRALDAAVQHCMLTGEMILFLRCA
jgi:hypothetical protein